jgi:hypothetical protein
MVLSPTYFILLMAIVFTGCSHKPASEPVNPNWLAPLDAKVWEIQNAGKPYSIMSTILGGKDCLRFEIRKGDVWENHGSNSFRTEISTHEFPPMKSEKWYAFSIFLPSNFPIEDNRLVLAQWWAKTKKHLGEVSRSPILHLRFVEGRLGILLRRYPDKVVLDDEKYIQNKLFVTNKFELGKWHKFVFRVKWSSTEDGFIQTWWNGNKIIDYKGITENQDEVGPVFKFGLYRDDSPKTYVSCMREVFISDTPIGN